jgi:hypothetical protein
MFATEKPLEGEFSLIAPNGKVAAKSQERHGGPPYFWFAELESPAVGTWQAQFTRADKFHVLAFAERPVTLTGSVRRVCVREGAKRGISPGRLHWPLLALASIYLVRGEVISLRRFAFYRDLPRIESNKWVRLKRILAGHSNQRLTKNTQKAMQQRI